MGIGKIFIISAPSGAGKSTLVDAVIQKVGLHRSLSRAITYTTRNSRSDEKDGYDFHYLTVSAFKERIKNGFFLEWSNAHINYYGTSRSLLDDIAQGKSYLLIVDRVGAEQIRAQTEQAVLIWITVRDITTLKKRLIHRGTENPVQINRRLKRAQEELALEEQRPIYDYHIMNDNFDQASAYFEQIIAHELDEKEPLNEVCFSHTIWGISKK